MEQYIVVFKERFQAEPEEVIVPNRQALTEMLSLMGEEYLVISIDILPRVRNYIDLINDLNMRNKPFGLEFGNS